MNLEMDEDVRAVAEFMQQRIPATNLVSVAAGVAALAPLLWGHYRATEIKPLTLSYRDLHTQSVATEFSPVARCADGGFAAEADAIA